MAKSPTSHAIVVSRSVVLVDVLSLDVGPVVHFADESAYLEQTEGFQVVWIALCNLSLSYSLSFANNRHLRKSQPKSSLLWQYRFSWRCYQLPVSETPQVSVCQRVDPCRGLFNQRAQYKPGHSETY
jgi:hypothetical protein